METALKAYLQLDLRFLVDVPHDAALFRLWIEMICFICYANGKFSWQPFAKGDGNGLLRKQIPP
jgi:hypothetical protein